MNYLLVLMGAVVPEISWRPPLSLAMSQMPVNCEEVKVSEA